MVGLLSSKANGTPAYMPNSFQFLRQAFKTLLSRRRKLLDLYNDTYPASTPLNALQMLRKPHRRVC
jgi:hypothetical protein